MFMYVFSCQYSQNKNEISSNKKQNISNKMKKIRPKSNHWKQWEIEFFAYIPTSFVQFIYVYPYKIFH